MSESSGNPIESSLPDASHLGGVETVYKVLTRVGYAFGISIEASDMRSDALGIDGLEGESDSISILISSAQHAGIALNATKLVSTTEIFGFVREGFPVVLTPEKNELPGHEDSGVGQFLVLEKLSGSRIEGSLIDDQTRLVVIGKRELKKRLAAVPEPRVFVCKEELALASISEAPDHHGTVHHHAAPLQRFLGLLSLDKRDIWSVVLFALVSGTLGLATPLAIESLVNVVSWGTYVQPLIVLGMMLLICLGLSGILKILQTVVVEMIQRRQFVRVVGDLAHRFPRANQSSLVGEYPRELANRVFDIMTIQKATAVLLLDGIGVVLTALLGMVLLAFYHPFLLGFDIVLVLSMISITWVLGRGGVRTAIEESITKYRVAHWLQDVLSSPSVFKISGGESLAIQRANQLTSDYIYARQAQFQVVIRQVTFAIMLQVIASTALLALGGWLVISGELTLGQLVASELVVTVVVGAFAKAGKSLEKFYDLMAGIDKVGHLIDIPTDPRDELGQIPEGPAKVEWSDLEFVGPTSKSRIPAATIQAGSQVAIVGDDVNGRQLLSKALAGLVTPTVGLCQIAGFDSQHASANAGGRLVSYAGRNDIFHGTLRENTDMGRTGFGQDRVRDALQKAGLAEVLLQLPDGMQSRLQTGGYPLTPTQTKQLRIARAILASPKLMIIDGLLDDLSDDDRQRIWKSLTAKDSAWTLVVNTNREDVAKLCSSEVAIRSV